MIFILLYKIHIKIDRKKNWLKIKYIGVYLFSYLNK
jgi:hypothetical protein